MISSVELAEAVVGDLNGSPFGQQFIAERSYAPSFNLEELADATAVTVIPGGISFEPAERGADFCDREVQIGVHRKIDPDDVPAADALFRLAEQIADHYRGHRLAAVPDADPIGVEVVAPFIPEDLRKEGVFKSFVKLTYRLLEEREG